MKLRSVVTAGAILSFLGSVSIFCTAAIASVSNDQVTSQKIKEADGTNGQDTNSGSGVKTNHIQDGAVTMPKIADGAVSTPKLLDGSVTAQKLGIVCPDGQYLQYTPAGGWTCSVGTPGPAGPQGPAGPEGPTGPMPNYANIVVVAKSGGDFTDPVTAMNSITDATAWNPYLLKIMPGIYDLGSGWLLMKQFVDIEGSGENTTVITSSVSTGGGTFRTGTVNGAKNAEIRFLTVRNTGTGTNGVALSAGSSSLKLTHVTASTSGATEECDGIYAIDSSTLMNNVTATASGGNYSYGIWIHSSSSSHLMNVTTSASGSAALNVGISMYSSSAALNNVSANASGVGGANTIGVNIEYSSPVMNNVNATGSGGSVNKGVRSVWSSPILSSVVATASEGTNNYGIDISRSSSVMSNVTAIGKDGTWNSGLAISGPPMTLHIDRSTIEGSTGSIEIYSEHDLRIGASKLGGGIIGGGGTLTCVAAYNENYAPLDATCQ